jgi:hypothetical protein
VGVGISPINVKSCQLMSPDVLQCPNESGILNHRKGKQALLDQPSNHRRQSCQLELTPPQRLPPPSKVQGNATQPWIVCFRAWTSMRQPRCNCKQCSGQRTTCNASRWRRRSPKQDWKLSMLTRIMQNFN